MRLVKGTNFGKDHSDEAKGLLRLEKTTNEGGTSREKAVVLEKIIEVLEEQVWVQRR